MKIIKALRSCLTEKPKQIVFGLMLAAFLVLSVIAMLLGQEIATIGYVVGAGLVLLFLFPGTVDSVRFGSLEMNLRRAEEAATQAREIAKLVSEIAIPLAHHSTGWAENAPATVQMRDAVLSRARLMRERYGVELSPEIRELDYVKTCHSYEMAIVYALPSGQRSQLIDSLPKRIIPATVEDLNPPQTLEDILKKVGGWDNYMATLIEDYRYFYEHRTHRNLERWQNRAQWKRSELGAVAKAAVADAETSGPSKEPNS